MSEGRPPKDSAALRLGFASLARAIGAFGRARDGEDGERTRLADLQGEMISIVSHELRTPLTAISGYVKLLAREEAGPINETQREFLRIVEDNVGRLTGLINDLLEIEKMGSGNSQLALEPVDLRDVLRECADALGLLAREKGLELRVSLPEAPAQVTGERRRLIQVFMNLLVNAIKYTERGFVALELAGAGGVWTVRVTDSGPGMSAEERDGLFSRFQRGSAARASGEAGSGLGLVIARQLVEAHQGSIEVASEPGHGTTFSVRLPSHELPAPAPEAT